jgi:hypothetical protein
MKLRKRYFLLILLALLPFYKLIHLDDYCFGDVDLLAIGALSVLFTIALITIVFYNLYRISLRNELFNFRPLIIAGVFGIALFFGLKYHNKNPFKDIKYSFIANNTRSINSKLLLFTDGTFELKIIKFKNNCHFRGTYTYKSDSLFFKTNTNLDKNMGLDSIYFFDKSKVQLIPKNQNSLKFR